jgi:hypothetical protein
MRDGWIEKTTAATCCRTYGDDVAAVSRLREVEKGGTE